MLEKFCEQEMSSSSDKKKTTKRAPVAHTQLASSRFLNAISVADAEKMFQVCAANATQSGTCLFPHRTVDKNKYPRVTLNQKHINMITDAEVKKEAQARLAGSSKIRIPYHLIAWRASGNILQNFEDGKDVSHKCRRGMMVLDPKLGESTQSCTDAKTGCFNKTCLKIETHEENLARGTCDPIMRCSSCRLFFSNCSHSPRCGASDEKEAGLAGQKAVKRIRIEYQDGTTEDVEFPLAAAAAARGGT